MRRLGMDEKQEEIFGRMLKAPFGIILVTGPTGSGKSTTLYAALSQLAEKKINCVTVEDPVEKLINGVTQVQVNAKAGLTFATALRSILRQDPDVIMVGEIRDEETADIGVRAAVTGHLVLSTLHTNDCVSAVYRLQNMGIPFYMIAAATTGVVAQRLVKVLCPHCRRKIKAGQQTKRLLYEVSGKEAEEVWEAVGCEECLNTGYSHRRAIYEMFELNETTKNMIRDGETAEKIRRYQRERGFLSLQEQAAQMVMNGEMDMEEAEKATYAVVMDKGNIIAQGTPTQLKNQYSGDYVLVYGKNNEDWENQFLSQGRKFTYNHDSNYYRILVKNSIDAIDFIDRNKNLLTDFEVVKGSMDDVFLNLTGVRNMEEGK